VAPDLLNDLGIPTAVSLWTRATGQRATDRTLGSLNLIVVATASLLLVFAFPARVRLWLAPVFLLIGLVAPLYSSPDSVAIHGSLAALAVAIPVLTLRAPRPWMCMALGLVWFCVHKVRSVYGIYSLLALLPALFVGTTVFKDRRILPNAGCLLLGFLACEIPWRIAVHARVTDARVIERDALPEHAVYEALISGIGYTENPWGIKPQDPWVAQFLADWAHADVVHISTQESERRAKAVFFSLARQRPTALLGLYARRIPHALANYSILGAGGAVVWVVMAAAAVFLAARRRDKDGLLLLLPPTAVAGCLVLQIVMIDTRYIYAHPLEPVSAIVLAAAIPVALRNTGGSPEDTSDHGRQPRPS
jgi:hypothetical protein